jgi:hypothetical protein
MPPERRPCYRNSLKNSPNFIKDDNFVKSPKAFTPAKAGVQNSLNLLDSCFRRNDKTG